jgi:hypothetical protein
LILAKGQVARWLQNAGRMNGRASAMSSSSR